MADTAHQLTDEKLEEMEKRLSAIYSSVTDDEAVYIGTNISCGPFV